MKKLVQDKIQISSKGVPTTRDEFVQLIDAEISSLKAEERSTAKIELMGYSYDYDENDYYGIFLTYQRLETDKEEQDREALEQRYKNIQQEADRVTYQRLKKQFGDTDF